MSQPRARRASGVAQSVPARRTAPLAPGWRYQSSPDGVMTLTLPYPVSTNRLYRNARTASGKTIRVKTQEAKDYAEQVSAIVLEWRVIKGWLPEPPYRLAIVLYPPSGHRIDVSNGVKCLEDAIFAAINRNDREVVEVNIRAASVDREHPRAEVSLSSAAPPQEAHP